MQQFKGTIYQAVNIQNRKSYIGKTTQNFEKYKEGHIENALKNKDLNHNQKAKYFYNAIRKYGPHNFKWIILGEIESYNLEELNNYLNKAEKESIWIFRTFGSNGNNYDQIYGYNKTKGGDGVAGRKHTEEEIENIRKTSTGRKHTQETKDKLSNKLKGKKSWTEGTHRPQETKDKIGQSNRITKN